MTIHTAVTELAQNTLVLALTQEVGGLISAAEQRSAIAVNAELTIVCWQIGKRLNAEVLHHQRAEYGAQLIRTLAKNLIEQFGQRWSEKNLRHCVQLAHQFTDENIVYSLSRQLTWTHLRSLIYIEDPLKRDFYIEICKLERWSVRQLQERIKSMLFERTAISKKPQETIRQELDTLKDLGTISADLAFRDPYILDFLGLKNTYSETDLETAILDELQQFITELGSDFAFMARQKRLSFSGRDYKIDLLFYHRRLKCLVAIDLKIGEFEAAYKGQMELYLRWLEKNEHVEGENPPIGLILCAGKSQEFVELLQLDSGNIRVAEYLTLLPSQELLAHKLHHAIDRARQTLAVQNTL